MASRAQPRYRMLKERILERIASGELKPRDRVPSEHELCEAFGVSRMTANRALRELDSEGYVERIAGRGTFVADLRAASHVLEVRNIADEIAARGHRHRARVLALEGQQAPRDVAGALHLAARAGVLHARIVHFENDIAVQYEERWVRPDFAPEFLEQDFTATTPSAYLNGIAPLQEADHVVRAALPDSAEQRALDIAGDEPVLVVVRRTWADGEPVTFARLVHPGSRFELAGHYIPPGEPGHSPL